MSSTVSLRTLSPMEALRCRSLLVGADSEYELYTAIADGPVVLPTDVSISAAARKLLLGGEADGSRGILAKDPASRMTIAQIRESDFVSKGGAEPLPPSLHVRICRCPFAPCTRMCSYAHRHSNSLCPSAGVAI